MSLVHLVQQKVDKLLTSLKDGLKIIVSTSHMRKQFSPKGTVLKHACRTLKAKPRGRGWELWVEKTDSEKAYELKSPRSVLRMQDLELHLPMASSG